MPSPFLSPLRYPGGKRKLAEFMKLVVRSNELLDGEYAEPYAGGASVALALLYSESVRHVHINDLDSAVYAFWHAALTETEALCRLVRDTPVSMDEWNRQKAIQGSPANHTLVEVGFSTLFLNRTNRSGILTAGVIGGKGQTGTWKLDARFNKVDIAARIQKLARYSGRVSIYNLDADDFIKSVLPDLPDATLVYLDPPYYVKGQGLYENHYSHDDHARIAGLVRNGISQPWIVSYDAALEVEALYRGQPSIRYGISYSAQDRYSGSEVMFFSPRIRVPEVTDPARIGRRRSLTTAACPSPS